MASACDAMVVVGGSHSANSRHLYEICRSACANVQFIENAAQLDKSAFVHVDTVGLTAGASVPAWIIKEVKQKMSDEILTQENPRRLKILMKCWRHLLSLYIMEKR